MRDYGGALLFHLSIENYGVIAPGQAGEPRAITGPGPLISGRARLTHPVPQNSNR